MFDKQNSQYRVLTLPVFPVPEYTDSTSKDNRGIATTSPNELLGGFFIGPENRVAELAARFATEGVPIFDRPLGKYALNPIVAAGRMSSRADVEILLQAASEDPEKLDRLFGSGREVSLFNPQCFNSARINEDVPAIVGYRPLESIDYLSPLVFYGSSGSGKTRLVEGICQFRRAIEPNKTLYYLSCSDFIRALNDAVQRDQTQLFRSLFSQANTIAIENADIIAEKESAQQEFLPLLDAALKAKKLVVLTFSQLPSLIEGISPELNARLATGLLVPVKSPSWETKICVVDLVTERLRLNLDEQTRALFVERCYSSIGTLCASLTQYAYELSTMRLNSTVETAEAFFKRRSPEKEWKLNAIVKTIAKYLGVSVAEARGKKRSKTLVFARQCIVFFARRLTDATFQEIGAIFSDREHSTVIHSAKEIEESRQNDPNVARALEDIARMLKAEGRI